MAINVRQNFDDKVSYNTGSWQTDRRTYRWTDRDRSTANFRCRFFIWSTIIAVFTKMIVSERTSDLLALRCRFQR